LEQKVLSLESKVLQLLELLAQQGIKKASHNSSPPFKRFVRGTSLSPNPQVPDRPAQTSPLSAALLVSLGQDNNASERAIRNVKGKQEISGQFKTGQNSFCVIRSVIDTLCKRGIYSCFLHSEIAVDEYLSGYKFFINRMELKTT
jgi:hypothetical protein